VWLQHKHVGFLQHQDNRLLIFPLSTTVKQVLILFPCFLSNFPSSPISSWSRDTVRSQHPSSPQTMNTLAIILTILTILSILMGVVLWVCSHRHRRHHIKASSGEPSVESCHILRDTHASRRRGAVDHIESQWRWRWQRILSKIGWLRVDNDDDDDEVDRQLWDMRECNTINLDAPSYIINTTEPSHTIDSIEPTNPDHLIDQARNTSPPDQLLPSQAPTSRYPSPVSALTRNESTNVHTPRQRPPAPNPSPVSALTCNESTDIATSRPRPPAHALSFQNMCGHRYDDNHRIVERVEQIKKPQQERQAKMPKDNEFIRAFDGDFRARPGTAANNHRPLPLSSPVAIPAYETHGRYRYGGHGYDIGNMAALPIFPDRSNVAEGEETSGPVPDKSSSIFTWQGRPFDPTSEAFNGPGGFSPDLLTSYNGFSPDENSMAALPIPKDHPLYHHDPEERHTPSPLPLDGDVRTASSAQIVARALTPAQQESQTQPVAVTGCAERREKLSHMLEMFSPEFERQSLVPAPLKPGRKHTPPSSSAAHSRAPSQISTTAVPPPDFAELKSPVSTVHSRHTSTGTATSRYSHFDNPLRQNPVEPEDPMPRPAILQAGVRASKGTDQVIPRRPVPLQSSGRASSEPPPTIWPPPPALQIGNRFSVAVAPETKKRSCTNWPIPSRQNRLSNTPYLTQLETLPAMTYDPNSIFHRPPPFLFKPTDEPE
jgi:hypothetical protein